MKNINFTKIWLLLFLLGIYTNSNSQNIQAETEDGQKVTLMPDNTWEISDNSKSVIIELPDCEHSTDFVEPECDEELKAWFEKMQITTSDLKNIAANDNGCSPDEVLVTNISESQIQGEYELCIKGEHMKYYRTNMFFHKHMHEPIIFH